LEIANEKRININNEVYNMPAYYDFFRKFKFLPNDETLQADSTTDTLKVVAGSNIAFDIDDTEQSPGQTLDQVTINGPEYDVYVPVDAEALPGQKAAIRLERSALGTTLPITTDIEIKSDPFSPILVDRVDNNTIVISSSSPELPFSKEQIEDFAAELFNLGTHTELTFTYNDNGAPAQGSIDAAVTSTLQNVTDRGNTTTNSIRITDATGSTSAVTGALRVTGGAGIFENLNVGGTITGGISVTAPVLVSQTGQGTAPLTVSSTTMVSNLQAETASRWHVARTLSLDGDLSGFVSIDGSGNVTLTATIVPDAVALGTDTTGNYVAAGAVSGNGLSGSANSESATFTVSSNATATNTAETIVFRDASGNFSAGTISANLTGVASQSDSLLFNGGYRSASSTNTNNSIVARDASGVFAASRYAGAISGGGTGQGANAVKIGWGGSQLLLEVDVTDFGSNWPIGISGAFAGTTVTASDTVTFNAGAVEDVSVQALAASATVTLDAKTNSVYYYTANATANWTMNFRGDASTTMNSYLAVGKSTTVVFLATQGAVAYYPVNFLIDGSSVSPRWLGGTAPTGGNASGIDSYTFTIIKTAANTYTVLASQARFA
jgi:hypothetical protein